MKIFFLLGLALTLITACQKEKQRYFSESPEIETVKAGIKAYEAQDWESWKANLADTAKFYPNTTKGISSNDYLENTKSMVATLSSYGFDQDSTFIEMVIDKNEETWVNYWSTWKGTISANNKTITIPVHLTLQFVNGKIVEEYGYWDMSEYTSIMQEIEATNNLPVEEKVMLDAINKVTEGWNAHDMSNLKSLSADKFTRTANGTVIANNINEYETFMNTFVTGFPDFAVKLNNYDIKGNKVYIDWTCTGTHNGDFMGNAPTGKKIKTHGISVWSMNKDGKFTREDAYYDNLDLYNQLGITPPKA